MVLLISYDLNNHERPSSYKAVRAVIERYAISARKPLYSQWLVETQDAPQTWSDRIRAVADEDDRWLVVRVQRVWLPKRRHYTERSWVQSEDERVPLHR